MNIQLGLVVILSAQLSVGLAASPVIGVVTARGGIRMDESAVNGSGTLFEGTTVETGRTASNLRLNNGMNVQLASGSKGIVYGDRLVLTRGGGQLATPPAAAASYRVEARSLRVEPVGSGASGTVQLTAGNRVQVAATRGNLRVTNGRGVMIASLAAGRALDFAVPEEAGAFGPALVTGCLVKRDGRFFLTDEAAGVTVELKGSLEQYAGHRIQVNGSQIPDAKPAAGASQVVQAGDVKQLSDKCSSKAAKVGAGAGAGAAAAGTAGAAAGGAATGGAVAVGSAIAAKAVIAGVIVAAATTGAVVAVTGEEETPISR
ncbi:MAG: hypothetical protein IT164_01865 [Bryobacterales bacterium]|nr:hypothetical protein [Bryobacterales bacterium]